VVNILLKGQFAFLGNSEYTSVKVTPHKTYFKSKFISSTGKELELETTAPLEIPQFAQCNLVVEIIQGKFPRFTLVKHEILK
jgi:hypothetical protein